MGARDDPIIGSMYSLGMAMSGRRSSQALAIAALVLIPLLIAKVGPALSQENFLAIQLAQTGRAETPRIAVAPVIAIFPGSQTPLTIGIISTDDLPKSSVVRVRGLPVTISLSDGYAIAPGAWEVPLDKAQRLQMNVPTGISGRSEVSISLLSEDGMILAEAKSILAVQSDPTIAMATQSQQPTAPVPQETAPVITPADREAGERFLSRGEREIEERQYCRRTPSTAARGSERHGTRSLVAGWHLRSN